MKMIPLGDIATVEVSNVDKKCKEEEPEVILCNFVDVYHNWHITKETAKSFMSATANTNQIDRFSIRKGQVAITKDSETRDDIGVATYIADDIEDAVLGYHCALITPDETVLTGEYLNIIMNSSYTQKYFEMNASGSGQRYTLTKEIIEAFPVPIPDMSIQKVFGKLLSDINNKIALNNSICADLEAIAKLIYDYWFVQFDFPDANGRPYKSSGGKMVWNEDLKREIPEGWDVKSLPEVSNVKYGVPLATDNFTNVGTPVIRIRDILNLTNSAYTNEIVDNSYFTEIKDLLIGMDGNFQMNFWDKKGDIVNQRIVKVRKKDISNLLVRFQIEPIIKSKVTSVARSTVGHLSDADIKGLKIIVPSNNVDVAFFDDYLEKICQLKSENRQLTEMRDFLLPMLMNGQIGFKET